jgi:hypothetical protein
LLIEGNDESIEIEMSFLTRPHPCMVSSAAWDYYQAIRHIVFHPKVRICFAGGRAVGGSGITSASGSSSCQMVSAGSDEREHSL